MMMTGTAFFLLSTFSTMVGGVGRVPALGKDARRAKRSALFPLTGSPCALSKLFSSVTVAVAEVGVGIVGPRLFPEENNLPAFLGTLIACLGAIANVIWRQIIAK